MRVILIAGKTANGMCSLAATSLLLAARSPSHLFAVLAFDIRGIYPLEQLTALAAADCLAIFVG